LGGFGGRVLHLKRKFLFAKTKRKSYKSSGAGSRVTEGEIRIY